MHFVYWKKWKWCDIWPSMVTYTRNLCSAFNPSKVHTYSSERTHTVNTHPEQWAAIYAVAPGEQLGVRCLAQGYLSHGIEGGKSAVHSLPLPCKWVQCCFHIQTHTHVLNSCLRDENHYCVTWWSAILYLHWHNIYIELYCVPIVSANRVAKILTIIKQVTNNFCPLFIVHCYNYILMKKKYL